MASGSQPGRRGTLGCSEEVQGVPPNIGFTGIPCETYQSLASRVPQSSS